MSEKITTGDMYECAYYLSNHMEIDVISCRKINGKISCDVTFSGSGISELQFQYFKGKATVNLFDFRRAYTQMGTFILDAKRQYKQVLHQQQQQMQGGRA